MSTIVLVIHFKMPTIALVIHFKKPTIVQVINFKMPTIVLVINANNCPGHKFKMPTIVGILKFMTRASFMLIRVEFDLFYKCKAPILYTVKTYGLS